MDKWLVLCVILFVTLLYCSLLLYVENEEKNWKSEYFTSNQTEPFIDSELKLILAWTAFYGSHKTYLVQPNDCPYKCYLTYDKKQEKNASLILFHARDFYGSNLPKSNVPRLMFSMEPPWLSYFARGNVRADYFNYSMTYRHDSDVRYPYLPEWPKSMNLSDEELDKIISKKKKFALIATSHCKVESKRTEMVEHLKKKMQISAFGKCFEGPKCDKKCLERQIESHFFYLAFENSICPDYATEKFTRFTEFIVPIVFRRSVIPKEFPSEIFIAMDDFPTTDEFVHYLKMVAFNKELYKSYLRWAQRPELRTISDPQESTCQLCKLAHLQPQKRTNWKEYHSAKDCDKQFVPDWIKRNK